MVARVCGLAEPCCQLCWPHPHYAGNGYVSENRAHWVAVAVYNDTLFTAFGLRAMFGIHVCAHPCRQPQMLLQDGFFWHACAVLTAIVNILATTLIGYKAWCVTVVRSVYQF